MCILIIFFIYIRTTKLDENFQPMPKASSQIRRYNNLYKTKKPFRPFSILIIGSDGCISLNKTVCLFKLKEKGIYLYC